MPSSTYTQLVTVTRDYLGGEAERFVIQQISSHLSKSPKTIEASDIPELAEWLRLALSLYTSDTAVVDAYMARVQQLADRS